MIHFCSQIPCIFNFGAPFHGGPRNWGYVTPLTMSQFVFIRHQSTVINESSFTKYSGKITPSNPLTNCMFVINKPKTFNSMTPSNGGTRKHLVSQSSVLSQPDLLRPTELFSQYT